MISLIRTDSTNPDFIALVKQLDAYLAVIDGVEHHFYNQFNQVAALNHVVVAYDGDEPIACGAIKEYLPQTMEIKRMYTLPEKRGKGTASRILTELEKWATEMSYRTCVLETGKRQAEAISLYLKCSYQSIPNYGQYAGVENSVCFEKQLS